MIFYLVRKIFVFKVNTTKKTTHFNRLSKISVVWPTFNVLTCTHICLCITCACAYIYAVEFGYNATKGTECFVLLYMSVVTTEGYNVMVNGD
jgi:hypothetical protein